MSAMPQSKIDAFFVEFPWLSKFVDRRAQSIFIKRIDEQLFGVTRNEDIGYADYRMEPIYLLNESGESIGQVGVINFPCGPNFRWWKFWTWPYFDTPKESVLQAIRRIGEDKPIHFILSIEFVSSSDFGIKTAKSVTIYKVPKGFTAQTWLTHQSRLAIEEIQKERAQIDAT